MEFWTDRKYYKNVVKITTELGVSWGEESKVSGKRQYIQVRKIMAGKFHRYAGWKFADYFKNFGTTMKDLVWGNIVGFIGFAGGIIQSFCRMLGKKNRPDVVFLKGGFVGLPVGIAARFLHIPYVVHESDAVPGLANRLLIKRATKVALSSRAASLSPNHNDDASDGGSDTDSAESKFVVTGVPVAPEFKKVSERKQSSLKKAFGFPEDRPLIVMTGGSQGSQHMNEAMRDILPEMLKFTSVGLVAGRERYEEMVDLKKYEEWEQAKLQSNFRMWAFNSAMNELMGAADVVISRAGATTIAELAALGKAVILVPFEKLPGGHQVKNAEYLKDQEAVEMVTDSRMVQQPGIVLELAKKLIHSPKYRAELSNKLHETYHPNAAKDLAKIVMDVGEAA